MLRRAATSLAIALAGVLLFCGPLDAQTGRVMLVLDASGSMWARVGGTEKIDVARDVLSRMLADLPDDMEVGLAAYGHRREKDCDDIEVLLPVGGHDRKLVERAIRGIQPRGMTPITAALDRAVQSLGAAEAPGPTHVILVSDGKETCAGDPCALVRALRERGVQITVHVVGFDVTAEESEQLQCIADAGGGRYAAAASAADLAAALGGIRETVVEASADAAGSATPPRAEASGRKRPSWRVETGTDVYAGELAIVRQTGETLVIQLVNDDAVNLGMVVLPGESRERAVEAAFFSIGRGRPCHLVVSDPPFSVALDEQPDGWIEGTLAGVLACPDNVGLRVCGTFSVPAAERTDRR
jgi:hypothetical protein